MQDLGKEDFQFMTSAVEALQEAQERYLVCRYATSIHVTIDTNAKSLYHRFEDAASVAAMRGLKTVTLEDVELIDKLWPKGAEPPSKNEGK